MLISIFFLTLFIFFNVILHSINYLFVFSFFLNSNILSFLNRIHVNDFFFNNLYFFWTNLWYIPLYIFILLFLFYYNLGFIYIKNVITTIFIFFVINITYLSYFNCNLNYLNITIFPESINILLSNSVNKIHPLLLYISLLIFLSIFINFYNSELNTLQINNALLFNNMLWIKHKVIIIIYTLYLGSWWALQEGSWGGWWNWDFSEVFGLFILYKLLTIFHTRLPWGSLISNRYYFTTSCILLFLFYLSIQLNFSYVSHNFGFRFYKFISTTVLLNYLLVVTLILLTFFQKNFFLKFVSTLILKNEYYLDQKLNHLIIIFISSTLYLSLLILVNDFIWNNFNLNLFNFQYSFNNIFLFFIYLLILFLFHIRLIYFFFIIFYQKILINFFLLIFSRLRVLNFILILHYLLIIIFLYTLFYHENMFSNLIIVQDSSKYVKNFTIVTNTLNIENVSNIIESSTTFDNKYFQLNLYKNIIVQQFYPTGFKDLLTLFVYDGIVIFIYVNFIIIFYVLIYQVNKLMFFK